MTGATGENEVINSRRFIYPREPSSGLGQTVTSWPAGGGWRVLAILFNMCLRRYRQTI